MIACDLAGPFPRSKKGNQYIFIVSDIFTKITLPYPIAKANSKTIINILEKEIFLVYGVPQIVICDNGSQFISQEFKNLI